MSRQCLEPHRRVERDRLRVDRRGHAMHLSAAQRASRREKPLVETPAETASASRRIDPDVVDIRLMRKRLRTEAGDEPADGIALGRDEARLPEMDEKQLGQ